MAEKGDLKEPAVEEQNRGSLMCGTTCQRHPLASLSHAAEKMVVLDERVSRHRVRANHELRKQLLIEMEGLAIVAIHDLTRLMWSLRTVEYEPLAD